MIIVIVIIVIIMIIVVIVIIVIIDIIVLVVNNNNNKNVLGLGVSCAWFRGLAVVSGSVRLLLPAFSWFLSSLGSFWGFFGLCGFLCPAACGGARSSRGLCLVPVWASSGACASRLASLGLLFFSFGRLVVRAAGERPPGRFVLAPWVLFLASGFGFPWSLGPVSGVRCFGARCAVFWGPVGFSGVPLAFVSAFRLPVLGSLLGLSALPR